MKMKNKKEKDQEDKRRHLDEKNEKKKKNKPFLLENEPRKVLIEEIGYIIITNGKNTEVSYFRGFRKRNVRIEEEGGLQPRQLVEKAIEIKRNIVEECEMWCVFDVDPNPTDKTQKSDFNAALQIAEKNNVMIAYSNEAFEYWLLLHFEDHQGGGMKRDEYGEKLNKHLKEHNIKYLHSGDKKITREFFDIMLAIDEKTAKTRQQLATERAKKIYEQHEENETSAFDANSSTTVFKLVEKLSKN